MTTLMAFLFVIGVIVFFHELGHFIVARCCGVRVEVFSLGFGPRLLTVRRHDTAYCLSAIPVGGYIRMAGERSHVTRTADEFVSKPKWQRGLILAAGPAMNLLLAAALIAGVAFSGIEASSVDRAPAVVGFVVPGSPAERAGIVAGDQIVRVAGQAIHSWEGVEAAVGMRPHRAVLLTIRRGGHTRAVTVTPESAATLAVGTIGVLPQNDPTVRAAGHAGRAHDAVGGTGPNARSSAPTPLVHRAGPVQAARLGLEWTARTGVLVLQTLHELIAGGLSPTRLMGPVGIATLTAEAASISWTALLGITAVLSVNVGIFNLLPIPVLDGGHMLLLGIEAVARRDFSARARRNVARTGLAMLLILTVLVFYNDLSRLAWVQRLIG